MILQVEGLAKSFGIDIIFEDVSFRLDKGDKAALLGRNGTGKTTLLNILIGKEEPDAGQVFTASGIQVGILDQVNSVTAGATLREEVERGVEHLVALHDRLKELEGQMESSPSEETLAEYAELQARFHEQEGWSVDTAIQQALGRMGFPESEWDRTTDGLSGGEQTRLALARLLVQQPDLLVLDEPTNHLDLAATEWLEEWIAKSPLTFLIVSHDQDFLRSTVSQVIEMADHTAKTYRLGFDRYRAQKKEEEEFAAKEAARQAEEMAKLEEYVRRFKAGQRSRQAKGREKLLMRMKAEATDAPTQGRDMTASFEGAGRSGELVVHADRLDVGYPDNQLIDALNWTVRYGERWGVIGANGAGKSSLIKAVLGDLDKLGGEVRIGSRVEVGVFRQDVSHLDPEQTPLGHLVWNHDLTTAEARDLLGRFLFSGDEVVKRIGDLSGGERNKIVLAELAHLSPNLLILDEPTNHLDWQSREALAEALKGFSGTLVLVSHDRHLLRQTTDRVLDIQRDDYKVYLGGFSGYQRNRPEQPETEAASRTQEPELSAREVSRLVRSQIQEVEDAEAEVGRLEGELKAVEKALASDPDPADAIKLSADFGKVTGDLERAMEDWESAAARLEELKEMQGQ